LQLQYAEFRRLSRDDMNISTKQEEEDEDEAMNEEKKEENREEQEEEEELPEEPMLEAESAPVPLSGKKRSRRSSLRSSGHG
jgi:hypothetical protein